MGEILGVGCSHGPGIVGPPETLTDIYLKLNLKSDLTPAHMKDPKNWPAKMREEWADDEGMAYARAYQAKIQPAYKKARAAIDAFNPDFVVIFGDDQYEVFLEDCLPPFAIFAVDEVENPARRGGGPSFVMKGHKEAGNYLARGLIRSGFDISTSWKLPHHEGYGHAFTSTVEYLDMDHKGFPYPVIPISVNCYGSDMRIPAPGRVPVRGRLIDQEEGAPPPAPMPWRCYDLGKAVAQSISESPWKAVVIGSSSWSHASLTKKNYFLWPDVETDMKRRQELEAGEQWKWRDLTPEEIRDAGQHEVLNWVCLAGAMEGRTADILAYVDCYIFNSEKCVALFEP
ncbi:MAG TPA: extradiol ring-cleavage dioxygenase [Chloroflexota bacterium]|jgi:hypothetical protein